jgi:hypothetical protein
MRGAEGSAEEELMTPAERSAAVWLVCLAAVVEACVEPGWVYAQANSLIPRRAAADGAALVLKVTATYYLALLQRQGALAFGAAQLLYATAYTLLLYALLRRSGVPSLLPRPVSEAQRRAEEAQGGGKEAREGGSTSVGKDGRWLSAEGRSLGLQYCYQTVQKVA